MAEGFFRHYGNGTVEVYSAGTHATGVNPIAVQVMKEIGIDISRQTSNFIFEHLDKPLDYVITVCAEADKSCPVFPGDVCRLHWPFPDPNRMEGTAEERLAAFRKVRDAIGERIRAWVAADATGRAKGRVCAG